MQHNRAALLVLLLLMGFAPLSMAWDREDVLLVLTENWPPFNYMREGKLTGLGTDVVIATLQQAGIQYQIRQGVWKGVYHRVLQEHDTLIYTISRTEAREDLFEWIGPIAEGSSNFMRLRTRDDITITRLEDARRYRVGVQEEDAITQDLIGWGFDPASEYMLLFKNRVFAYRALFAGRVDIITGNSITSKYQLALEGLPLDSLEIAYRIKTQAGYYMAFRKGSDGTLVNLIRSGFEEVMRSGELARIRQLYH